MLTATHLRAEYLTEPLGLGTATPRLTWTCEGSLAQTAYRILARRGDKVVWDTGRVESPEMAAIWVGAPLHSRDDVQWRLQLWDEHGEPGAEGASRFELGLLEPADWRATWISGDYRPRRRERYPVDCFRRTFTVDVVRSARLYITACGLYRAEINGVRVGDFVLAPGFTSYQKRVHYQTHDVTDLLREGENTLTVELADGWYRGSVGAMGVRNVYGAQTKLLAQLESTASDGHTQTILTDDTWEWSDDGPIRYADLKDGERVEIGRTPSYGGRARTTLHTVVPSAADTVPVREKERFTPVLSTSPTGVQLLDFGQNIAGYVEVRVHARTGDRVRLRFAEHLDQHGELDMASMQIRPGKPTATPKQEIVLICEDGDNVYKTSFAVFGFRYASVEAAMPITAGSVTAIAVYSDMPVTASFASSHTLIDKFVENTLWSMKGNFLDVPTDCPTRERSPWTGDVQIFARTGTFLMDTAPFLRKWMRDLHDRQGADGKVPCHAPDVRNNEFIPGIDFIKRMDGSPGWADAAVLVPLRLYELYRDDAFLRDSYESMRKHVQFQISRTNRTGMGGKRFPQPDRKYISNVGQAFGEWLEPREVYQQKAVQDFIAPHPEEATAYLAYVCGLMVDIARLVGRDEDIPLYEEYHAGSTAAYVNQFTPVASDRQSKLVRPLALGLLDGELADDTFKQLVRAIQAREYRIGTGFLSTPLILPLLSQRGRTDLAYRMIENEQEPGWLHEVLAGATTVWEDWEGEASQNHYSPGSVCQWLFETVCGIDIVAPRRFEISPQPGGSLTRASLRYDSVFGAVSSSWETEGDTVRYRITVPANTTARIRLPGGTLQDVAAGEWEFAEE